MSKQTGALIREARTAAGMSQKALAEKVDGLSASALGKAERGEKELTPGQLKAIAEAIGVTVESLQEIAEETAADVPEVKVLTDEEILELYKSADPETKKAAISMLKGEKPQGGDMMSMFAGMMGGGQGGEGGEAGANPMAGMMSMFGGMMGGQGQGGEDGEAGAGDSSEQAKAYFANMMGGQGQGGEGSEAGANPMAAMMSMFSGMMGSGQGGEGGEAGANPMAGMMSMFGGMMGGAGAAGGDNAEGKESKESKEEKTAAKKKTTKKTKKK